MPRPTLPLLLAFALLTACATPPGGDGAARPDVIDAGEEETSPQKPQPPAPKLPEIMPEAIAEAPDKAHTLFACMDYNHINLLADTDRTQYEAVLSRLGELTTAQPVCQAVVREMLKGFKPAVLAFEAEWAFYMTYFALTSEVFTDDNPVTFCGHLGQTAKAAHRAARQSRSYHRWLTREVATSEAKHPFLEQMLSRSTEKVSGLTIAASELNTQYQRECKE